MITMKNVSFRYQGAVKNALSDINLAIPAGCFLGIIGSSGAGKSTLAYVLNGVVPHHFAGDFYGSALVGGLDTVDAGPEEISRLAGSVFQDIDAQMTASVVEDEILFGLENFGVDRGEIEGRLREALEQAGIGELRYRTLSSLSGGQKQKAAIAAVTALRPRILILDEPTGELDPGSSRRVFQYLKDLNEKFGITIVVVEQKIMLLCEFAESLAVMDGGRLVYQGRVAEALQRPELLEAAGVHVPRLTTLGKRLREEGLYRGSLPCNGEEARAMIREALSGRVAAGRGVGSEAGDAAF